MYSFTAQIKNRTSFYPSIALVFVILMNCISGFLETRQRPETENELEKILDACAGYCERIADAEIHFVCQEKIAEEIYHYPPGTYFRHQPVRFDKEISTYVYIFRFSLEGNRIRESRDLVEENGEKKHEESASLKTMHYGQEIIFLEPFGLLSGDSRSYYRYKILGKGGVKGEKAVVIEVIPLDEEADDFTAKIWVRDGDFSLLKIERVQKAIGDFEGFRKTSDGISLEPHIICTTEFLHEKNGIRFPTMHSITEAYYADFTKKKRLIKSLTRTETTVIYEDYNVETKGTRIPTL